MSFGGLLYEISSASYSVQDIVSARARRECQITS